MLRGGMRRLHKHAPTRKHATHLLSKFALSIVLVFTVKPLHLDVFSKGVFDGGAPL